MRVAPATAAVLDFFKRIDEPAVPISRAESSGRSIVLEAPGCSWSFRPLANDAIFTTFSGDDSGDLTDIAASSPKTSWFLDLKNAHNVCRSTTYASPLSPLVLTLAKYRSGTDQSVPYSRDLEPFCADLIQVTSGELAASVGIG